MAASTSRSATRPGFYSADHLQLNHYYTRSEAELAAKIGRGPNLAAKLPEYERKVRRTVANIEADEVEDRAALDYLARIGWRRRADRADRLDLQQPAGADALPDLGGAADACCPDSICIADDGSGPETKAAMDAFAAAHPELTFRHVWHEDRGFEKTAILNKAIATSEADLLIFIDGDVLIHPDFIARHLELARPGAFSTGSLIRLDAEATASVTPELIEAGAVFDRGWLRANRAIDRLRHLAEDDAVPAAGDGLPRPGDAGAAGALRRQRLGVPGRRAEGQRLRRDDQVRRRDKEFGVRLKNAGVRGRHLRYTAPLVHLDHPRSYADPAKIARHKARMREVRRSGLAVTPDGIVKAGRPPA